MQNGRSTSDTTSSTAVERLPGDTYHCGVFVWIGSSEISVWHLAFCRFGLGLGIKDREGYILPWVKPGVEDSDCCVVPTNTVWQTCLFWTERALFLLLALPCFKKLKVVYKLFLQAFPIQHSQFFPDPVIGIQQYPEPYSVVGKPLNYNNLVFLPVQ